MIAHLSGNLYEKTPQSVIIRTGGVGYEVFVPLSTFYSLPEEEQDVSLHIYTHVREDALVLFGFHTKLEKELFVMLTSVSGIGPRLAANILSGVGPHELLEAMAGGDAARLRAIPGVGKKTAERIALELKDSAGQLRGTGELTVPPVAEIEDRRLYDDALSALMNLGYSAASAKRAVERAASRIEEPGLEELIREALKILG